jgi:hypothetical protein
VIQYVINKIISAEVSHQQMQADYFAKREKVGPLVIPKVWQPVIEPLASNLAVIFREPGALHLVFLDEIAPFAELDQKYRQVRREVFNRTTDVESVELVDQYAKFIGNYSIPNVYKSSFHWTSTEEWGGNIFSDTWNHLFSTGGTVVDRARGGYRQASFVVFEGDRAAAERWVPNG